MDAANWQRPHRAPGATKKLHPAFQSTQQYLNQWVQNIYISAIKLLLTILSDMC